jgi:hypothetical protein
MPAARLTPGFRDKVIRHSKTMPTPITAAASAGQAHLGQGGVADREPRAKADLQQQDHDDNATDRVGDLQAAAQRGKHHPADQEGQGR